MAASEKFAEGIRRMEDGMKKYRVVMLCSEEPRGLPSGAVGGKGAPGTRGTILCSGSAAPARSFGRMSHPTNMCKDFAKTRASRGI